MRMSRSIPVVLVLSAAAVSQVATQSPKTHRLEATPETIAYGHYWSETKPVLRIASGDIIDVDTLLTNTPQGLTRAGLAEDRVQASLKAITAAFREHGRGTRAGDRTRQQQQIGRASCRERV